jgi:hypothetical protein
MSGTLNDVGKRPVLSTVQANSTLTIQLNDYSSQLTRWLCYSGLTVFTLYFFVLCGLESHKSMIYKSKHTRDYYVFGEQCSQEGTYRGYLRNAELDYLQCKYPWTYMCTRLKWYILKGHFHQISNRGIRFWICRGILFGKSAARAGFDVLQHQTVFPVSEVFKHGYLDVYIQYFQVRRGEGIG